MEASFSKSFRGYDVSEVDAYVQSVQNQETESQNALAKLNQKTAELEVEVARLREIESSLFRALKLAEESQQNFAAKMEKEAKSILDKASKEAEAILKKAETDAQKQALLTENERKQTLAKAIQEVKEQERQLRNMQEAQAEIVSQLKGISGQIVGSIASWNAADNDVLVSVDQPIAPTKGAKRGRKPGVKNKPKVKPAAKAKVKPAAKIKPAAKTTVKPAIKTSPAKRGPKPKVQAVTIESNDAKPAKAAKVAKPAKAAKPNPKASKSLKVVKPAAKRGPKPSAKKVVNPATKPAAKRGPKPKITLETVSDDGLPTLNKVLEAYAKSSGPRGKVGEIN